MNYDRIHSHAFAGDTVNRTDAVPAHEAHAPASGRPGILTALAAALQDRETVWQLSRKSDRVLADMGLNRDTLAADVKAARLASIPPRAERQPATGLYGVVEAAVEAALGTLQDFRTASSLRRKPDRVLADLGLNRETLTADVAAARKAAAARRGALVSQRLQALREQRRIFDELSHCTDVELSDIGIARADIGAIAREHATMLFHDSGLVDRHFAADDHAEPANGPIPLRRVA